MQIGTLHYYDNINGEERDTSITAAELDIDILVDGVGNIGRFTYGFGFEELPGSAHGKHRATWSLTTPDTLNFAYGGYWYDLQLVGFSETETLADFDPSSVFTEYQVPDLDEEDTKSNDDFYLYGNVTRRGPVGTSVPDGGTTVLLLGCGLGLIGLMKRHR